MRLNTTLFETLKKTKGVRYKKDKLAALPDMPVTDQLTDVGRFILEKKPGDCFE